MIRERAVNKNSRRGNRLIRLTVRGTKLTIGGKTEIEYLTRKPAESEDLHFNGKTKIEDSLVKAGGGSERKTFGGCHGAGAAKHCTGASTTGVWMTVARGVLEKLCREGTVAPVLKNVAACGTADTGVGVRGLNTPAHQSTGERES
jgi:hypothetical protein